MSATFTRPAGSVEETKRERIAICLSGGGYRASLFHLGALRRLHEMGILAKATWISSVSGGSILAGHLSDCMVKGGMINGVAFQNWQKEVADPFRRFTSRDMRTWPFFAHVFWNWIWPTPRVRHLEARYRKWLTQLALRELPATPNFILCATDLSFGVNWEFSRERVGDYQAGYAKGAENWPLARAVTASACFPPLFGPMRVPAKPGDYEKGKYQRSDRARILAKLALSDGGVYDNMGLEPVWEAANYLLVSDCGAPFDFRVGETPLRRLLRYTSVVTSQTRALRVRMLFEDWNEKEPCKRNSGTYWRLAAGLEEDTQKRFPAAQGYSQLLVDDVLSRVRTDLDAFTEAEKSVLENHGYFNADYKIRRWLPQLPAPDAPAAAAPYPQWMDEARVRHALRHSHKRISLTRVLETAFGVGGVK
jgi:NTE family protein